jgi:hypothetical protein
MAKKKLHHKVKTQHKASHAAKTNETYLVLVRSWMLLVMFALMLGTGAVLGTYLNHTWNSPPMVAGAETQR